MMKAIIIASWIIGSQFCPPVLERHEQGVTCLGGGGGLSGVLQPVVDILKLLYYIHLNEIEHACMVSAYAIFRSSKW